MKSDASASVKTVIECEVPTLSCIIDANSRCVLGLAQNSGQLASRVGFIRDAGQRVSNPGRPG